MRIYFLKEIRTVFLLTAIGLNTWAANASDGCASTATCAPPPVMAVPRTSRAAVYVTPTAAGGATCAGGSSACPGPATLGKGGPSGGGSLVSRKASSLSTSPSAGSGCSDSTSTGECAEGPASDSEPTIPSDAVSSGDKGRSAQPSFRILEHVVGRPLVVAFTDEAGFLALTGDPDRKDVTIALAHASLHQAQDALQKEVGIKALLKRGMLEEEAASVRMAIAPFSINELKRLQKHSQDLLPKLPKLTSGEYTKLIIALASKLQPADQVEGYIIQINRLLPRSRKADKIGITLHLFKLPIEHLPIALDEALWLMDNRVLPATHLVPIIKAMGNILQSDGTADIKAIVIATFHLVTDDRTWEDVTRIVESLSRVNGNLTEVTAQTLRVKGMHTDLSGRDIAQLIEVLASIPSAKLEPVVTATLGVSTGMPMADIIQLMGAFADVLPDTLHVVNIQILKILPHKKDLPATDISKLIRGFATIPPAKIAPIGNLIAQLTKQNKDIAVENILLVMTELSRLPVEHLTDSGEHTLTIIQGIRAVSPRHLQPTIDALLKVKPEHRVLVTAQAAKAISPTMSGEDIGIIIQTLHTFAERNVLVGETEDILAEFRRLLPVIGQAGNSFTYQQTILMLASLPKFQLTSITTKVLEFVLDKLPPVTLSTLRSSLPSLEEIYRNRMANEAALKALAKKRTALEAEKEKIIPRLQTLKQAIHKAEINYQDAVIAVPIVAAEAVEAPTRLKAEFESKMLALQETYTRLKEAHDLIRPQLEATAQVKRNLENGLPQLREHNALLQAAAQAALEEKTKLQELAEKSQAELDQFNAAFKAKPIQPKVAMLDLHKTVDGPGKKAAAAKAALTLAETAFQEKSKEAIEFQHSFEEILSTLAAKSEALAILEAQQKENDAALKTTVAQIESMAKDLTAQLEAAQAKVVTAKGNLERKSQDIREANENYSRAKIALRTIQGQLQGIQATQARINPTDVYSKALRFLDTISIYERILRPASLSLLAGNSFSDE